MHPASDNASDSTATEYDAPYGEPRLQAGQRTRHARGARGQSSEGLHPPTLSLELSTAERIGQIQASKLADKLQLDTISKDNPKAVEILLPYTASADGSDDEFAKEAFAGAWSVLQPYFKKGTAYSPSGLLTADTTDGQWESVAFKIDKDSRITDEITNRLKRKDSASHTRIDGIIAMIHEIGKGTPMGRILGAGTATTARCFGIERAPVVKGQAMPAYDPRAVKGQGVTYATTTMGADHTAGYAVATNILGCGGKSDPLSAEGQAEISRNLQIATAAIDATGYCLFTAFALLDQPETMQALVDTINAMYDLNMTLDDVTELGKDILRKERAFNAAAGFTKAHDRLPLYFSRESVAPHNVRWDVSDEDLDSVFNFNNYAR